MLDIPVLHGVETFQSKAGVVLDAYPCAFLSDEVTQSEPFQYRPDGRAGIIGVFAGTLPLSESSNTLLEFH